jgi:hypothetical protein
MKIEIRIYRNKKEDVNALLIIRLILGVYKLVVK